MLHMTFFILAVLFLTGVFASIVDTIGGGGGLIALPVLLSLGVPMVTAFGTNKLQGIIGETTASIHFFRHQHLNFSELKRGLFFVAIGGSCGALFVQFIHPDVLNKLVPFLLLGVLVYTFLKPKLGRDDIQKRMSYSAFYMIFGLGIGFYNGFFGPATGSFWVFALMFFMGKNMQHASMHMKPLNLMGNLASIIWFIIGGKIAYTAAAVMAAGQLIGARIGAHLVVHKGTRLIRPVYLIAGGLMTVDLFIKNYL